MIIKKNTAKSVSSVAREMAWIKQKSDEREIKHQAKKAEWWKISFDPNYFYYPTFEQFKLKVNAIYPDRGKGYYPFLVECHEKYARLAAYYNQYLSSHAEEQLLNGYMEILYFVLAEQTNTVKEYNPEDALKVIKSDVLGTFKSYELKANISEATDVKVAAFIRELWQRGYFLDLVKNLKRNPTKELSHFANVRYGRKSIENQFNAHMQDVKKQQILIQFVFK